MPDDIKSQQAKLTQEWAKIPPAEAMPGSTPRAVSQKWREELIHEIERLYHEVASELNDHSEDATFALKTLNEAQEMVLTETYSQQAVLYRLILVKTMLIRKRTIRRWSYTWGLFIFFYGVLWLIIGGTGYFIVNDPITTGWLGDWRNLIDPRAVWFSALAGGIGGAIGILYNLYRHVADAQDFDRHYVKSYLLQPLKGFLLGGLVYVIVAVIFFLFGARSFSTTARAEELLTSRTDVAISIVIGWLAGFRPRSIPELGRWLFDKTVRAGLDWLKRWRVLVSKKLWR